MNIELDEQTMAATLLFGAIGWFLYENPQYQDPAVWIGGAIVVGWAGVMTLYLLSAFTELMLWDALWEYTRGDENGA